MPDVVYDAILGQDGSNNNQVLKQVTQSDFDPHYNIFGARNSGNPYVATYTPPTGNTVLSAHFLESANPEAQLTTMDIGGFLTLFGALGARIADGSLVQIPWVKRQSGGTLQSGAHHMLIQGTTSTNSITTGTYNPVQLVPVSISAPRNGPVTANGEVHFLSGDGLTNPFTAKTNQSLSSQNFGGMYSLGPCWLAGSRISRMVGFNVNFGVHLSEKQRYDGCPFPSDLFIEEIEPTIEIQVEDFDQIASWESAVSITTPSFAAFLRQRYPGGTFFADNAAQHIKLSFASGIAHPQAMRASETKHGNAALIIRGVSLTVSVTSAVAAPS